MAVRVVRHIGGRIFAADTAKPLAIIPYFPGERPRHIRVDAYQATRSTSEVDQPPETNWLAINVPWQVVLTHATQAGSGGVDGLDEASEWDTIWRNLVLEYGTDGNEFYGGDGHNTDADVPEAPGENNGKPEIERSMGPLGIQRLYSREVLMRPLLAEGDGEIRWFDEFNTALAPVRPFQHGGVIMFGVIRYTVEAQTNFGVEMDSAVMKAMRAALGADMSRVQNIITNDTGATGDAIRTLLFGGDNYIEADTIQSMQTRAHCKVWASIESPYSLWVA